MEAEKKGMIDELEWHTLLEILLNNTKAKFTLLTRNNNLIIQSDSAGIQIISERLTSALGSSDNLRYFLPYQISNKSKPKQLKKVQREKLIVPPPENTVEAGQKIFDAIFSTAFNKLRFNGFFRDNATVENCVLWSEPVEEFLKPLWQMAFTTALATFDGVDINTLRAAWTGDASGLHLPTALAVDKLFAQGLLQQCIIFYNDIDENNTPRLRIRFDFGLFYKLLFPPIIETVEIPVEEEKKVDGNTHEISIEIDRLTTYLKSLVDNGVLLRVFKDKEDPKIHADPVFITSKHTEPLPRLYVLFLDRSGSMSDDMLRLTNDVIDYINGLRQTDPNARIRIVPFSDKLHPIKPEEFPVSEEQKINAYLRNILPSGETYLYTYLDEELKYLLSLHKQQIKMVVFTDGRDTSELKWVDCKHQISTKILELNQDGTFQIIPIGAGQAKEKPLIALAQTCGTSYTYFKNAASLHGAFKEAVVSEPVKKLVDLVVKLRETTQNFRFAVPQDGGVHMPLVSIPFFSDEPIVIQQGNQPAVSYSVSNATEVPQETLVDKLRHYKLRATKIATTTSKPISTRISEIEKLLLELASLNATRDAEVQLIANAKNEIQILVINRLRKAQDIPEHAASVMTRIGAITGVTQHLTNTGGYGAEKFENNNNNK